MGTRGALARVEQAPNLESIIVKYVRKEKIPKYLVPEIFRIFVVLRIDLILNFRLQTFY